MKKLTMIGFVALIAIVSCKKEDTTTKSLDPNVTDSGFKNQVMQGKIGGEAWMTVSGKGEVDFFDSTSYSIDFYNDTSSCSFTPFAENKVFGHIPRQLGKYTLNSVGGKAFLTLYHGASQLNFARSGEIEINKIDTSTKIVEGKVSLPGDENYNMNGNFSLKICN